jgi:hypothetical protein
MGRWMLFFVFLLVIIGLGAFEAKGGTAESDYCPPLAPPSGTVVNVSTVSDLVDAVNQAEAATTILIADGIYNLDGAYLRIDTSGVVLRSASGNREAVVLDGNYDTTEIIQIVASGVTVADLTLREAYYHPIHIMSSESLSTDDTFLYNLHIIDPGEQAVKINPAGTEYFTDNGVIACSHIELTDTGRPYIRNDCYTGGIDAHQSRGWLIRDNVIEGFWCTAGLSEHAIHFWRASRDTLVERNTIINNARGIGFGLATDGEARSYSDNPCPAAGGTYVDHYDGIIRNNTVFANREALFSSEYGFDCGICLWTACEADVLHNTVFSTQPPFSSIEWRFPNTWIDLTNNLVSHNLRERDGAYAVQAGNVTEAQAAWFVNAAEGDLHLTEGAVEAIDQGVPVSSGLCDADMDGDPRPIGTARDVGADEIGSPPVGDQYVYLPLIRY